MTDEGEMNNLENMDLALRKRRKRPTEGVTTEPQEPEPTYDQMLSRCYIEHDTSLGSTGHNVRKFVTQCPIVASIGSKKTAFMNFADICNLLKRCPEHLLTFLLAELGTSGSIDGSDQLIIKGRFKQKQIQNVLQKYIKEYVICLTCYSSETVLVKETRLYFIHCETCGSRRSVTAIKSGFQALTTSRARIRALGKI